MIDSEFYFLTHLWSKLSPEQVTSGYTTEEDCKKWPREVLFALSFMFFISWSHFSIFISPCFCFFSLSIQSLSITQVCTISKETKRKFNPVTKCEKVREVPCQALETGTETFKRNETNKIYCFFRSLKNYAAPLAVVLFRALRFATMRFGPFPFVFLR